MNSDKVAAERNSPNAAYQDRPDEIKRPVPRRMSGLPPQRGNGNENASALAKAGNSSSTQANGAEQRLSAWTPYPGPPAGHSPVQETVVPPPDTEATLATQAAAQQLWENQTKAESDQTASTTPPPESPPHSAPQPPTSQPNTLQAMLNGLGNIGNLTNQQAMQLHELYLKTLKAALTHSAKTEEAVPEAPHFGDAEYAEEQQPQDSNTLTRPKAERVNPANGSLSMLAPDVQRPYQEQTHSLPPPTARFPPASPFHPAPNSAPPSSQTPAIGPQQVVELLGEMLRAQASGAAAPPQGSLPSEQPPLIMGNASAPYPSYRYNSQEASFRDAPSFTAGMDPESLNKLAARRWNSTASLASESSLYNNTAAFGNHLSLGNLPQNLTGPESQALLNALQQKYQASEMESMANMTIQAILTGSANREAQGSRKRKLPDIYEEQAKRHNSLLSEGETYPYASGQQQICTECGTTNTPTWRRSGKRLMCNACGLRRSRSIRSARSASMPIAAAQAVGIMEHPVEEPVKMHAAT